MKPITAYKCEQTGEIYEDAGRAAKSEFVALMKRAGGSLPAMGSINSVELMTWVANQISSSVYPDAFPKLLKAIEYLEANYEKITGREHWPVSED